MGKIVRFEDLNAWREARKLAGMVFELCRHTGLKDEYSLSNQIKRSSISIMANIAEGFGRYGLKDSKQFYIVARGSVAETQSHLYVIKDVVRVSEKEISEVYHQSVVVYKLVNGLITNSLKCMGNQAVNKELMNI